MPLLPTYAVKNPSPQSRAPLRWLDAFTTTHDVEALTSVLTGDYTHYIHPKSLGLPSYDRAGFLEYAEKVPMPLLTECNTSIFEVIETPDKVVLHSSSDGLLSTGHSYTSEIMMIAHVSLQPDGEYKVKLLKESVDPNLASEFYFAEVKRQDESAKST